MARLFGHITLVAVGRLRENHWQIAQADYVRRLGHYTDFRLLEVKDAVGKSMPDSVALAREGEQLLATVPRGARRVLMDAGGRQMSSPDLATYLQTQLETYGDLAFVIGGPAGFDPSVVAAADDRLALSRMTFPHELARVILLEQLYRAFTILRGEPYHR